MEYQIIYIIIILAGFVIGRYPKDNFSKIILWLITFGLLIQIIQGYWTVTLGNISILTGSILLVIHSFKTHKNSKNNLINILGITIPVIIHLIFTIQNYPYASIIPYTQIISILFWVLIIIQNKKRSTPNFGSLTILSFWALTQFIIYQTT